MEVINLAHSLLGLSLCGFGHNKHFEREKGTDLVMRRQS